MFKSNQIGTFEWITIKYYGKQKSTHSHNNRKQHASSNNYCAIFNKKHPTAAIV